MSQLQPSQPDNPKTEQAQSVDWRQSSVYEIAAAVKRAISAGLSAGFQRLMWQPALKVANKLIDADTLPSLKPAESGLLDQARTEKYIPSLKQALLLASLATPGLAMNPQAPGVDTWLFIVGVTTGSAWFFITLEKVRKQLLDYGVAMTTDMLQAFLTVTLLSLFRSGASILHGQQSDKITHHEVLQVTSSGVTCAVLGRCTWLLIKAVLKFDIMDTFNNGTAPLAKKFYESSLSGLRESANRLDEPRVSSEHAKSAITDGLLGLYQYYLASDVQVDPGLGNTIHTLCIANEDSSHTAFFGTLLPVMDRIVQSYAELIITPNCMNQSLRFECSIVTAKLHQLQSGEECNSDQKHTTLAKIFRFLSNCIENFETDIGQRLMPSDAAPPTPTPPHPR